MAQFYSPKKENLIPLTVLQTQAIVLAARLLEGKLPHKFATDYGSVRFFIDKGMNSDNGVMGFTNFLNSDEILLSPDIVNGIETKYGDVPDNSEQVSVAIHELTHRDQRSWLQGIMFPVLNIPGMDKLTLEKWAKENELAAAEMLNNLYAKMRLVNKEINKVEETRKGNFNAK